MKAMSRHFLNWVLCLALLSLASGSILPTLAMGLEDLSANRRVDWTSAGYPGEIPLPSPTETRINVLEMGATADGVHDDSAAIQAIIDAASGHTTIFFPAGVYRLESPLVLKSGLVLRGAGSTTTRLECFSDDGCVRIIGSRAGDYRPIVAGYAKDTRQITIEDVSGFRIGQGGEIRQEDIDEVDPTGEWGRNTDWVPTHVVGQMVKVVAIEGNTLRIDPPLHMTLSPDKHPEIMPVTYQEQIGIEDLTIKRLNTGAISNNIKMLRAADCWFQRIESDQTQKYHFSISRSLHIEVRACYIHDAYHKGGGGRGYGVNLFDYATAVLVEDNIFSDLRHAMLVQVGANGCVFGYNYAQRNYDDDGRDKTAISVHGHYAFMNLFEGNIVGYVGLADYWGACGPGNTLFRNRIIGTDKHRDFGPYRGIAVDDYSHTQNLIGNELIGGETRISFDGQADRALATSQDLLLHANNVHGTMAWDPGFSDHLLPDSFYRVEKPLFMGQTQWPALGPDLDPGTGSIPALERFESQAYIPQEEAPDPGPDNGTDDEDDGDSSDRGDSANTDTNGSSASSGGLCFTTVAHRR